MKENIVRRIPAQPTKEFNGVLKFSNTHWAREGTMIRVHLFQEKPYAQQHWNV